MKHQNYIIDPVDAYLDSLPVWVQYCLGLSVFAVCWAILFTIMGAF